MKLKSKFMLIIFQALLLLILLTSGCSGKYDDAIEISLKDMQTVDNKKISDNSETLRVAFSAVTSPQETVIYYNDLLKYIEKESGLTVKVIQRKTYKQVNDLIQAGEVDLAFICTYAYTLGAKEFGLQPFLVPQINGMVSYGGYIIVSADSSFNTFADLKGKRFAYTDPLSNTGYIYPSYLIKQSNANPETYFKKTMFTYSHDNSIKAVLDKIVDGAAVDSLVYDYLIEQKPYIKEEVRIIDISEQFGMPPVVLSTQVNAEMKEKLKKIFLNMHHTEEGKIILEHLKIEQFQEQVDANYDSIRKISDEVFNGQ